MGAEERMPLEKGILRARLKDKLDKCWTAYRDRILTLAPARIIERAAEISAASFCHDQLTNNSILYSEDLLGYLLQFDDPLEAIREQWMEEQAVDLSGEFKHAMWSLWDHGPKPDETPIAGGMAME